MPDVVLIDGPSGAGKSRLADRLAANWPSSPLPTLVRMDDIYPGWDGLQAGSEHVNRYLLQPRSMGEGSTAARWSRFDWTAPAGEPEQWQEVDPARPLIVEGCGTLSRANASLATVRIWLDADDQVRKRRALDRDHGGFDAHWDRWQAQFERFVQRERPMERADLILDGSAEQAS